MARPRLLSRWAAWILPASLAAGTACSKDPAKGAQGPAGVPVKIEVARSLMVKDTTEYVATLKSRGSAVIMPEVEGQITRIFVRSGQRVSEGTPLMQIDPAKQQATVKSQEDTRAAKQANLEFARQQYDRVNGLSAAGVASQQELDQARSALEAAQAELQALDAQVREQQVQLRYYRVSAPTAGVVGDIPVRVGDRVTTSTMLTTVDQPGGLEAYVSVPVERAGQLRLGTPVEIVDGAGKVVAETRIGFISPQVDSQMQTVLAKATIESSQDLRPAQFIRARVVWGAHQGLVVPVLAVSRISGQYFAFVAEDKGGSLVARQRPLKLGEIVGNDYVVLDGIKPGERVIVSGTQFLVDGAPVSPQT
jgi:RND family efflux transporter MFP subunit